LNLVKVNFDASFIENTKTGAWGFVARDDIGEFIAAAAGKLRHIGSALQAETEACAAAVEGAAALGLHRIVFESDCQTLVNALKNGSYDLSDLGVLIREARSICIASFEFYEFSYCPRSCNKIAHVLAQHGLRADVECVGWADYAPDFVSVLVTSEIAESG
jgi:ribonuclease HI